MENAILKALDAEHVANGFGAIKHSHLVVVILDGRVVATIAPSEPGFYDRLYVFPGEKTIGPSINLEDLRRRICRDVFRGNEAAMSRAEVVCMHKDELGRRYIHQRNEALMLKRDLVRA